MFRSLFQSAALALTIGFAATPTFADTEILTIENLDRFEELLRGFGSVERDEDGEGDPMFRGRMNGLKYTLYFYDCEATGGCNNGIFVAYFDGDDYKTDLSLVNAYNNEHRFGKISVDSDGDLELNMTFVFKGGITRAALDDTFDWWNVVLEQAEEYFE